MREPLEAVEENDPATNAALDGELTSLVRRWMAAGTMVQDRVRRESILRVAPEPDRVDPERVEPERGEPDRVESHRVEPGRVEPDRGEPDRVEPDRVEPGRARPAHAAPVDVDRVPPLPPLPRRTAGTDTSQRNRIALLIDARRMSADVASALLARVGERGSVYECRAYADWGSADLRDWAGRMRQEGLQSFHHFSDDGDQALVAMTVDAMDIAGDAAVDEVVIAGDLTSALPLVHRLLAAGVRVVAVGAGHTPHDVRAACHEFIDTEFIDTDTIDSETIDGVRVIEGRHRA